MPTILGISVRLCSWIWVTAWKMLMTRPITRPTSSSGPAIFSARLMACEARFTRWRGSGAGFSSVEALHEGFDDQVPAVDQDEQEDLERQRDEGGRQHDHAHAHQRRRDDQVDDQEWQEDQEADLKRGLELRDDEGRDQHLGGHFGTLVRRLVVGQA